MKRSPFLALMAALVLLLSACGSPEVPADHGESVSQPVPSSAEFTLAVEEYESLLPDEILPPPEEGLIDSYGTLTDVTTYSYNLGTGATLVIYESSSDFIAGFLVALDQASASEDGRQAFASVSAYTVSLFASDLDVANEELFQDMTPGAYHSMVDGGARMTLINDDGLVMLTVNPEA